MPRAGTTSERGYGSEHQRARTAMLAQLMNFGSLTCWRCGLPIMLHDTWDVGHDDADRRIVRGPEHAHCNRSNAMLIRHGGTGTRAPEPHPNVKKSSVQKILKQN